MNRSMNSRLLICLLALAVSTCKAAVEYRLETFAVGLSLPWSIAFLPDGSALVTELGGQLKRIDASGQIGEAIDNVPEVYFAGQGGLFDVLPHPEFNRNGLVYLSFAEGGPEDNGTAIARGKLVGNRLENVEMKLHTVAGK
ncbi:MAG: PQQ-dependent sugar dehydrogenase, partial [Proteobacteria bacterium]|nr:PQQ-dependent sugar dehydrogenase [Pseudomonadota bacterium]